MLIYPHINPIAFSLGPIKVHWYGLAYIFAFLLAWCLGALRIKRSALQIPLTIEQLSDLIFYSALGVVLGGRIGYILFYDFSNFIQHPLLIFKIWEGGMSFHGGLLGVAIALFLFSQKIKQRFFVVADFLAPLVPLGLGAGRIGNFINGELVGRVVHYPLPWSMIYPQLDNQPRHPSEIYEFLLEGLLLFCILWIYSRKPRPPMAISGLFLLLYGVFRFTLEFFREPDFQLGFVAFGWLTQGQLLCIPMIIFGTVFLSIAYLKKGDKNDLSNKNT